MEKNEDIVEIDVGELFLFMLKRWYVFLVSVLLTVTVGMSICLFVVTPQYTSTTKIIILSQQNSGSLTYSDMQLASQLTKDYEELIVSRDVLEAVISECDLEGDYNALLNRVEIENRNDTRIISIAVEDPSPAMAQRIADSIRENAAAHIRNVTDVEAVNIAEAANLPTKPSSPSKFKWAALSAVAGFLIVLVVQAIRFLSDDTIKSSEDVNKYLGLSTLALVPKVDTDTTAPSLQKGKSQGRNKGTHDSRRHTTRAKRS